MNRLQSYPLCGWEEKIVATIRQATHEYQNERVVIKYLRIIDKLMKVPGYQKAIGQVIVDLFC